MRRNWTGDELFDLDGALACGGETEEIADFLAREISEVERRVYELNLLGPR